MRPSSGPRCVTAWVERYEAPGMSIVVIAVERTRPRCSYPAWTKYREGPSSAAASSTCTR